MSSSTPGPALRVAVVIHVARIEDRLVDAMHAVAAQTHSGDALVILDATPDAEMEGHLQDAVDFTQSLPPLTLVRAEPGARPAQWLRQGAQALPEVDAFWLLNGDCVPESHALEQLVTVLAHDAEAILAAPKLMDADLPGRLLRFGIQITRSGRLQLAPRSGTPDQQQFDDRLDALAAPVLGSLVRRTSYDEVGGRDHGLGDLGGDLDLGWRAQLAGHHVLLVPRARVQLPAALVPAPSAADRRDARRVALARRPLLLAPGLALWIALSSLTMALGLVLLKRPAAAARAAGDLGAMLDPWRPVAARWRTRGQHRVAARDLRALFVARAQIRAHLGDRLHDVLVPRRRAEASDQQAPQTAQAAPSSAASPLLWGTLAVLTTVVIGARTMPGNLAGALSGGLAGGELQPIRADSTGLWHAWWDSFAGPGLGHPAPASPALPGLAVLSWIAAHLPGDAGPSPAGRVVALIVLAALPLAFISAYVAGRALTARPLPRAAVAGAWAMSPVATAAMASGRLGALAVLILLPLLLAALAIMTRPQARPGSSALAALLAAGLAMIVPGALVLGLLLGVGLLVAGNPIARRRAPGYLLVLSLACIPVLLLARSSPASLLGGWGVLTDAGSLPAWQLLLGQPDPIAADGRELGLIADYRSWLGAGLLVAGLIAMARPRARNGAAFGAAALALGGLAYAVLAPTLGLGGDSAGASLRPWPGVGLLLMTAGLLAAVLIAAQGDAEPEGPAARRWRGLTTGLVAVSAMAFAATLSIAGLGQRLVPALDPRPAVAIDQAQGPNATRSLVLTARDGHTAYDLIGREPGLPARDLAIRSVDRTLNPHVAALIDPGQAGGAGNPDQSNSLADPVQALAAWAVGFVIAEPGLGDRVLRQLDATAGLTRIGDHGDRAVWRVELPGAQGRSIPARLRISSDANAWGERLPVAGDHAATTAQIASGGWLLVAEVEAWARSARVSADGLRLSASTGPQGQVAYAVPAGSQHIKIVLTPQHRLLSWAYLAVLLALAYLATPIGAPPRRRGPDPAQREGR